MSLYSDDELDALDSRVVRYIKDTVSVASPPDSPASVRSRTIENTPMPALEYRRQRTDTLYNVQFKRTSTLHEPDYSRAFIRRYKIGDFVVVKGLQCGFDVGVITGTRPRGKAVKVGVILHEASLEQVSCLQEKARMESVLQELAVNYKSLFVDLDPMEIHDVELQFDHSRLFITYSCPAGTRMLYNHLLSRIHQVCKCQIIMLRKSCPSRFYKLI